jgi:hypothetical protein
MRAIVSSATLFILGLTACSPAPSTETGNARAGLRPTLTGTARSPRGGAEQAVVSIGTVTAHGPGGWVILREGPALSVDVMRLSEKALDLGIANLVGKVNQIRLHLDTDGEAPYVITADGARVPMKVPSGEQSGIKLRGSWNVSACTTVEAPLELDADDSVKVHPTGHGDLYILRPVIRSGQSRVHDIEDCDVGDEPTPGDDPDEPADDEDDCHSGGSGGDDDHDGDVDHGNGNGNGNGHGHGHDGDDDDGDDDDGDDDGTPTGGDTGGTPTGGDTGGTPTGGDTGGTPTGGDTGGTPTGGGTGSACTTHADCGLGFFCDSAGACSGV